MSDIGFVKIRTPVPPAVTATVSTLDVAHALGGGETAINEIPTKANLRTEPGRRLGRHFTSDAR